MWPGSYRKTDQGLPVQDNKHKTVSEANAFEAVFYIRMHSPAQNTPLKQPAKRVYN